MNSSLNKLDKKDFLRLIDVLWDSNNPFFREKFNMLFRDGFINTLKSNDTGHMTKLINSIPCQKSKSDVIDRIHDALPFYWNEKTRSFKVKKSADLTALYPSAIDKFCAMPPVKVMPLEDAMDGTVLINKSLVTKAEFVDFMLDTIVLNRDAFSENDLDQIEQTLEQIKKRILKKKVN